MWEAWEAPTSPGRVRRTDGTHVPLCTLGLPGRGSGRLQGLRRGPDIRGVSAPQRRTTRSSTLCVDRPSEPPGPGTHALLQRNRAESWSVLDLDLSLAYRELTGHLQPRGHNACLTSWLCDPGQTT